MESEPSDVTHHDDRSRISLLGWGTPFALGLITLILGVIIVSRPAQSLIAIAVLLGVVMIVSGIYHIARALDGQENERVWRGISGVLFLLVGLALLRHLHLSVALIGLFIGFTWIIQGVSTLMEVFSSRRGRGEAGWSVFFGIISLIAGVVVVAAPIASVRALTIFTGIWFIVLGAFEILGSLVARRAMSKQATGEMRVPGQRAGADDVAGQQAAGGSRPASRNTSG